MKTISFDFDDTISEDPVAMIASMKVFKEGGWKVIVCTSRHDYEETHLLKTLEKVFPVYYTGREAKQPYLEEQGISPDVWVDDRPEFIYIDRPEDL